MGSARSMRGLQPSQEDASKQIDIQWDLPLGSIANMVPRRQRELAHRTSNEFASAISVILLRRVPPMTK